MLDPVGEPVESADDVEPVHAHVECEVVARPSRDADKWNPGAAAAAATTASDPSPPASTRLLGNPGACGLAVTDLGLTNSTGRPRRINLPPAIT